MFDLGDLGLLKLKHLSEFDLRERTRLPEEKGSGLAS
jgi:hypothetical protein